MNNMVKDRTFNTEEEFKRELNNGKRIFVRCKIKGINFADVFDNKIMNDEITFRNCRFNNVNFENVTFNKKVVFEDCKFKNVSFREAKFKKDVKFRYSKFDDETDFLEVIFEKDAHFEHCKFYGEVIFIDAKFKGDAKFNYAEFFGIARFIVANFYAGDFERAILKIADFRSARFKKVANFWGTSFGVADFEYAEFEGEIIFEEATFLWAKFKDVRFRGIADFTDIAFEFFTIRRSTFEGTAIFKIDNLYSVDNKIRTIEKKLENKDTVGKKELKSELERLKKYKKELLEKENTAMFHLTTFKDPENVTFIDFSPSNTTFLLTNISKAIIISNFNRDDKILSDALLDYLKSPEYSENKEKLSEEIKKKYGFEIDVIVIIDDPTNNYELLKPFPKKFIATVILETYLRRETVLAEYRNLRKSFENNRTYQEASNLFIREMQIIDESLKFTAPSVFRQFCVEVNKIAGKIYNLISPISMQLDIAIEKIAHKIYNLFSYGESVSKPVIVTLLVLFLFPLILCWINRDWNQYLIYFENTTRAFFQLSAKGLGGWEILVRIFGAVTLGLLFIAFRRRLERK